MKPNFAALLAERISYIDILEHISKLRPSSSFVVHAITNVCAKVTPQRQVPITGGDILEDWIRNNKGLLAMDQDEHGQIYTDNLCVFRCLAAFKLNEVVYQRRGEGLARAFCLQWMNSQNIENFSGVTLDDMDNFEKFCNTPIAIYSLMLNIPPKPQTE